MKKIAFYTLGCKVNQYETQALKEIFINNGYEVVGDSEFAHVYVVNSCSVTGISDRKSRQFIRKTKRLNPDALTVIMGCYAETGTEKIEEIDEVDIVLGTVEKSHVYDEVEDAFQTRNRPDRLNKTAEPASKIIKVGAVKDVSAYDDYGIVSGMDSRTRAYIKIEDGCDRFCSYCVIPYARGPVRSRSFDSIIKEASLLIKKGYKELILTGINAALYGTDVLHACLNDSNPSDCTDLIGLIEGIAALPGEFRIRLSSLEPTVINADYASRLIQIEKLCPHLHLSLQSGSDKILKSMGRRYDRKEYLDIIDVLKSHDPNYSITTDIIVGFPGETEADFNDSLSIVNDAGFSHVHVFKYSKRKGTEAAEMSDQIPSKVMNERSKLLIEASEKEAVAFLSRNRGTMREALILEYDEKHGIYTGVTDNDIDVELNSDHDIRNTFLDISIS